MDNAAPPAVSGPPAPVFPPPPGPTKGMSGCLKLLLIVAGILAFFMLIVGIVVWQVVSWVTNMVQPQPVAFAPMTLSAGEQEDVQRILQGLNDAKQKGLEFDEYLTPQVFNGTLERLLQGERDKGKQDVPVGVRGAIEGGAMRVQFSAKADQKALETAGKQNATTPFYVNGEVTFDLEIADGQAKVVKLESLKLGGRQAPAILMWIIRKQVDEALKLQNVKKGNGENPFGAVKVLKREGDRLHLVLDGKKIPD